MDYYYPGAEDACDSCQYQRQERDYTLVCMKYNVTVIYHEPACMVTTSEESISG